MFEIESTTSWALGLGAIAALVVAIYFLTNYLRRQAQLRRERAIEAIRQRDVEKWEALMAIRERESGTPASSEEAPPRG